MISTILQIVGLSGITLAGILEFGVAGGVAGASITAIYVGLAMES